jgi:hypothetical protein
MKKDAVAARGKAKVGHTATVASPPFLHPLTHLIALHRRRLLPLHDCWNSQSHDQLFAGGMPSASIKQFVASLDAFRLTETYAATPMPTPPFPTRHHPPMLMVNNLVTEPR